MTMKVLLALTLLLLLGRLEAAKLPSYFGKPCSVKVSEEELNACTQKAANMGIPSFAQGDKKLKIPNMMPLLVPKLLLQQGTSQVGLNLTWEPLEMWGVEDGHIKNMKFNWNKKTCEYDMDFKRFTLSGDYKSTGKILLLPLSGSGPSNFTFHNVTLHYYFSFPLRKSASGKEYATIKDSKANIVTADRLDIRLDGLFGGDKGLGDQMNTFLNEHWRDVLRELGPSIVEAAVRVMELIIQNFFNAVPIDELVKIS